MNQNKYSDSKNLIPCQKIQEKLALETRSYVLTGAALRIEAVILFEKDEQKDKSGKPGLAPWLENALVKKKQNTYSIAVYMVTFTV